MSSRKVLEVFTLAWKIENFSKLDWKGPLNSSFYHAECLERTNWYLSFVPERHFSAERLICYLYRGADDYGPEDIIIDFNIALYDSQVSSRFSFKRNSFRTFLISGELNKIKRRTLSYFVPGRVKDLRKKVIELQTVFFPNDTLEIKCYMWTPPRVCTFSKIDVIHIKHIWKIKNEELNQDGWTSSFNLPLPDSTGLGAFFMKLNSDSKLEIQASGESDASHIWLWGIISYMDYADTPQNSANISCVFSSFNRIYCFTLPLFKEIISSLSLQNKQLRDKTISLQFDLNISDNFQMFLNSFCNDSCPMPSLRVPCKNVSIQVQDIRKCENKSIQTFEFDTDPIANHKKLACGGCCTTDVKEGPVAALIGDLHRLHTEEILTDIILRLNDNCIFPAHRTILSARSPLFRAMFANDAVEKQNNVIDIPDLDADTVKRMLFFIYTGTIDNLQWENAVKLYYAGDKYNIVSLKNHCFAFIKSHLSITNVCEALVLADMHHDVNMKLAIQNFIYDHSVEVFCSDMWKSVISKKAQLAAEIMQYFFEKNRVAE